MKRTFITSILALSLISQSMAEAIVPIGADQGVKIDMVCQKIGSHKFNEGTHRTPPQIPNVYYDASASTVYFENPCYECTLELVVPGTDTVVYSYINSSLKIQQ